MMIEDKQLEEIEATTEISDLINYAYSEDMAVLPADQFRNLTQSLRAERIETRHLKRQIEAKTKMLNQTLETLEKERQARKRLEDVIQRAVCGPYKNGDAYLAGDMTYIKQALADVKKILGEKE